MDFSNLILQGGALGVVLACFISVQYWLLGHFTRALARIEATQYIFIQAMMAITKTQMQANFNLIGLSEEDKTNKAVAMYLDLHKTIDEIERQLDDAVKLAGIKK